MKSDINKMDYEPSNLQEWLVIQLWVAVARHRDFYITTLDAYKEAAVEAFPDQEQLIGLVFSSIEDRAQQEEL